MRDRQASQQTHVDRAQRAPLTRGVLLPEMESKDPGLGVQGDCELSLTLAVNSPRK